MCYNLASLIPVRPIRPLILCPFLNLFQDHLALMMELLGMMPRKVKLFHCHCMISLCHDVVTSNFNIWFTVTRLP